MKNSLYEKVSSTLKSHPIISVILGVIGILNLIGAVILYFWDGMVSLFEAYPLFGGSICSWFFALVSTGIVLLFAHINRGKKDQYEEILKNYGIWLTVISIAVLFYISINLASEALTEVGVPIFSESYIILGRIPNVTPQDVFLISLVFLIIFLVFIVAPRYGPVVTKPRSIIIGIGIIIGLFIFFNSGYAEPISETFIWDNVPGDGNERLINFLKQNFGVDWAENAEINKSRDGGMINISKGETSAEIILDEMKEKAILNIRDVRTYELTVKTENGKLNVYYSETSQNGKSEGIWPFLILFVVSTLFSVFFGWKMPEEAKKDENLRDLLIYFSILPAFVVASLVLIGHNLVTYPNLAGHIVVGFLFISGFATLVILTRICLNDVKNGKGFWIWIVTVFASLAAISGFSAGFLFFENSLHDIGTFRKILVFSISIILVILQYGFAYEKLLKYQFTEWWRKMKPDAMIICILAVVIVGAIGPKYMPWGIPVKLLSLFILLVLVFCLPWILGWYTFRKVEFRGFKLPPIKIPLPKYQGMVLVKADPGSLKEVVKKLDGMKGVYQTMVVRGDYDVCLVVEGVSSDDIAKKILNIRKIYGIVSTTTLTDIREFFDREVR